MFDTGNTGFMLLATSLVMLMTPGLAFFYGGLVGRKNVLTIPRCCHACLSGILLLVEQGKITLRSPTGPGYAGMTRNEGATAFAIVCVW